MKRGQKMRRSEKETVQREALDRYLETKLHIDSPKTRDTYIGALGGKLTGILQAAGVIDESLLTLTDPERLKAVGEWWAAQKSSLTSTYRTALTDYLLFRGVDLSELDSVSMPEQDLQIPPYHISLSYLVKSFFRDYKRHNVEQDMGIYGQLMEILSGEPAALMSGDSLRERTDSFQRIRWNALRRLEQSPDETAAGIAGKFSNILQTACQHIVSDCMARTLEILRDIKDQQVPYDASLLPCLENLQNACWQNSPIPCAHALPPLFRTVLLDCDASARAYPPGRGALEDERLWENGFLRSWLENLNGEAVRFLLRVPFPKRQDSRSYLAAALLHNSLRLAEASAGTPEANAWMETAVTLCGQYWKELCPALLHPPSRRFPGVPEPLLLGEKNGSVYCAQLRQRQARLLLDTPEEGRTRQIITLIRAQDALRKSTSILRRRLEDGHELLETLTNCGSVRELLAENAVYAAECCRRLALLEEDETCLTDVLEMYVRPCRSLLSGADPGLEAFDRICKNCYDTFFDGASPFVRRLRLQPGTSGQGYREEQRLWQNAFGLAGVPAPSIHLPLEPDLLRDAERFRPVYSGVFDSVSGKDPRQQKPAELALFQLLGSSQTSILQMNQVVDNLAMLRLFHVPGYQAACRAGFVSLSCYGEVHSPKIYLEKNLKNPSFLFSCSEAFRLPGNLKGRELEKAIDKGARGVMVRYLNGQASLSDFPGDCDREEMEFLAESWKIAFDCFQHSDLRRFHQNEAYRYPPSRRKPPYQPGMLSRVIQERIQALIREAEQPDSGKNLERLRAVDACFRDLGSLPGRSEYDTAADRLLRETADPAWEDLRTVIHQCYFLFNGSLCCDHILLTSSDPDFILSPSPEVSYLNGFRSPTAEYVYRQAWRPGTLENIGWPDLCDIALLSRELDLKCGGQSPEQRLAQKERETGLGYCVQKKDVLLMDYIARLSSDERVHVCQPEVREDGHFIEMEGT